MYPKKTDFGDTYRIRLKGTLQQSTTDWFDSITLIRLENNETLLIGQFSDQPALRGFLNQLWNRNFTVLSVEQIENGGEQNPPAKEGEE